MERKISQKSLDEIALLKEWVLTITIFFRLKYPQNETFVEINQIVVETSEKSDLRGMRFIYKDMNEWAKGLSHDYLNELNLILREKFGYDLTKANDQNLAKIKRIIQRGHLKTDDEFRLLLNRVNDIYADDSMKDEVEVLNKLMNDYEDKKRSKPVSI